MSTKSRALVLLGAIAIVLLLVPTVVMGVFDVAGTGATALGVAISALAVLIALPFYRHDARKYSLTHY